MQGRYPRTIAEFGAHQREVWVRCSPCGHTRKEPLDVLEAMFGAQFDLYAGYAALEAELRCDLCGKKHRAIIFHDASEHEPYKDFSFEEALNRSLERRAYWQVRDRGKPEPVRGPRRRRRR